MYRNANILPLISCNSIWKNTWNDLSWTEEKINLVHSIYLYYCHELKLDSSPSILEVFYDDFGIKSVPNASKFELNNLSQACFGNIPSMDICLFFQFYALCDIQTPHDIVRPIGLRRLSMIHRRYDRGLKGYLDLNDLELLLNDIENSTCSKACSAVEVLRLCSISKSDSTYENGLTFQDFLISVDRSIIKGTSSLLRVDLENSHTVFRQPGFRIIRHRMQENRLHSLKLYQSTISYQNRFQDVPLRRNLVSTSDMSYDLSIQERISETAIPLSVNCAKSVHRPEPPSTIDNSKIFRPAKCCDAMHNTPSLITPKLGSVAIVALPASNDSKDEKIVFNNATIELNENLHCSYNKNWLLSCLDASELHRASAVEIVINDATHQADKIQILTELEDLKPMKLTNHVPKISATETPSLKEESPTFRKDNNDSSQFIRIESSSAGKLDISHESAVKNTPFFKDVFVEMNELNAQASGKELTLGIIVDRESTATKADGKQARSYSTISTKAGDEDIESSPGLIKCIQNATSCELNITPIKTTKLAIHRSDNQTSNDYFKGKRSKDYEASCLTEELELYNHSDANVATFLITPDQHAQDLDAQVPGAQPQDVSDATKIINRSPANDLFCSSEKYWIHLHYIASACLESKLPGIQSEVNFGDSSSIKFHLNKIFSINPPFIQDNSYIDFQKEREKASALFDLYCSLNNCFERMSTIESIQSDASTLSDESNKESTAKHLGHFFVYSLNILADVLAATICRFQLQNCLYYTAGRLNTVKRGISGVLWYYILLKFHETASPDGPQPLLTFLDNLIPRNFELTEAYSLHIMELYHKIIGITYSQVVLHWYIAEKISLNYFSKMSTRPMCQS